MQPEWRAALDRLATLIEEASGRHAHTMDTVLPSLELIRASTVETHVIADAALLAIRCRELFDALREERDAARHRSAALAVLNAIGAGLAAEHPSRTEAAGAAAIKLGDNLKALLAYWRSKCGARAMPARRDIDPAEIPRLLPWVMLLDAQLGRVRYRLVGARIENAYGIAMTGKSIEEILPQGRLSFAQRTTSLTFADGCRLASYCPMITARGIEFGATRLMLPLSDDGAHVDMILGGLDLPEDVGSDKDPPLGIETSLQRDRFAMEIL